MSTLASVHLEYALRLAALSAVAVFCFPFVFS